MNAPLPDLSRCAQEPIRVPGAIQPQGWMAVIDRTGHLVAWSANWPDADRAALAAGLARGALDHLDASGEGPASLGQIELGDQALDVLAHRSGELYVLEFEPHTREAGVQAPIYSLARHFLPQMQRADSLQDVLQLAAREIKRLSGFGRTMVYRFDDEGHGEVLAEAIDPGYESYDGHRFPAGDVPPQARELYRVNHIRLIPDATYEPVPLLGAPGWDPTTLDLSFATLRSVSPVHLEYMRNMGTLASMSVSIVVRNKLWGLISCHNHEPKALPYQSRAACEHLGRLLSLQVTAKEDTAEVAARLELRHLTLQIVSHLADSDGTLQRLVAEPALLLRMARASGAAVVLNEQCWTCGDTPEPSQIAALAKWVAARNQEVWATDRLVEEYPPAAAFVARGAGVLALSISQVHQHLVLWFRPELVETIRWAGEPRKEVQAGDGRIHPRRSFSSWQQQVRGRSLPWTGAEIGATAELRHALIGIVLRRAEELAEVATELGRVNKELEAFSYTVSHDLRAPMRHIAGYVDLVQDMEGKSLTERSHRYLSHVKEAAAYAGHLVDALLDFSRMGRSAIKRKRVNTLLLVQEIVAEIARQEPARKFEWDIPLDLPVLSADPFLLQVALRNLLSNAAKYTRTRDVARIRVSAVRTAEGDGLEVADNGVGFQQKYVSKLFGVFQRLHQAEEFEGTGIGLASVRRIVERHGGTVWARGEPEQGAVFGFTLPQGDGASKARTQAKEE